MAEVVEQEIRDDEIAEGIEAEIESAAKDGKSAGEKRRPLYKRPGFLLALGIALIVGAVVGIRYWLYARSHESTDDAFIEGHVVQVSPKVSGHIVKLYVTDNQEVKEGDLIAEIDPRDYQARLEQARAALDAALARQREAQASVALVRATTRANIQQASAVVQRARTDVETSRVAAAAEQRRVAQARAAVATAEANLAQARAQVAAAEAEATRANADVARYQALRAKDEISQQRLDQAIAAARTANAQLEAARSRVAAAEAQLSEARAAAAAAEENARRAQTQIGSAQAQVGEALGRLAQAETAPQQVAVTQAQAETATASIEQLRAAVEQAELELSYTKIYAPASGRVTRRAVEEGMLVQAGQPLMAIVANDVWVVANFKETQVGRMRPGQPVEIRVDAYPDKVFRGHIDSIQAGTGARFSLIPPENATGNYVKVVQRVPVKIVFDEPPDPQHMLAPGMSVEPEVKVQ
ncbi:HlyD family secretion protein [Pyrinomonas methylaliphatogenes]|uniref:Multidrug resistance efflux pump n=1 Tax=Pyrinomonas methylaliphatogenes TaxID=454194 RepID=A0A0B6WW25_9BACT|nr:HlyD family secretion protein [Pyrinomonas methylaliphatogenes]CDM65473.1 multidrug resistance efflux pump [Pyrinomonas methylaliphatogenes]